MTNKLHSIFAKYADKTDRFDLEKLSGLTTNLQLSRENEIAFYRIRNEKAIPAFIKRDAEGKAGVLVSTGVEVKSTHSNIHVTEDEFENLQKELADHFYPLDEKMKLVGITGTNGKTSVVHLCRELMKINNKSAASIGTLGIIHSKNGLLVDLGATSPGYVDLRRELSRLSNIGTEFVFCEVSSHALEQRRFGNGEMSFSAAGWTNFTQDHLDYHGSMEEYFSSKLKIKDLLCKEARLLVHGDDQNLVEKLSKYSEVKQIDEKKCGKLPKLFTEGFAKKNFMMAYSIVSQFLDEINTEGLSPPRGRFSIIEDKNRSIVIDYAHTPDALENICKEVRNSFTGKFTVVFGCGGDRDSAKRPLMGKIAEKYADSIIVTNDNPRTEDPENIVKDISAGISVEHETILDRKLAIEHALKENLNGVILIAGKGHEEYQEINGVKNDFSDFEVVEKFIG